MDFVLSGYEAIMGNWAQRLESPFSLFKRVFENIFFLRQCILYYVNSGAFISSILR